jgi:hypothetical protein
MPLSRTIRDEIMPAARQLRLPIQAAPVDRAAMASVLADDSGVQASLDLDSFLAGIGASTILGALLS